MIALKSSGQFASIRYANVIVAEELAVLRGLTIELIFNAGDPEVRIKEDGWTAVTRDGHRPANSSIPWLLPVSAPVPETALTGRLRPSWAVGENRESQSVDQGPLQKL